MISGVQRVADRYLIKCAAQEACDTPAFRNRSAALHDFTPEVLAAFAEGFYLPSHQGRVAFGGLLKKLREFSQAIRKAPRLWPKIKEFLGVEGLTDLPKAIKEWAKRGFKALRGLVTKAFSTWPLKLYTLEKGKLTGVNDLIDRIMNRFPQFKNWMRTKVKPKVDVFDQWLRKYLPGVSNALMVAIYIWIWLNVVEFEWDFKGLMDAVTGSLNLSDLLSTLPGSGLGFLMNALNLGTFTLLPYTVAARIIYLMAHRYLVWTGRGFTIDRELLAQDLETSPSEIPA